MNRKREILVYADWQSSIAPPLMGVLSATVGKGKETFSFEYAKEWLKNETHFMLDPDLQLFSGRFFPKEEKTNFGIFLDSCPDRWGRILMQRREAAFARKEKRSTRNLYETDFLLGVYDAHRMGAMRFKEFEEGPFLNNDQLMAAPPWTSLRELENACMKVEEDVIEDKDYLHWLGMLIAPGSSLGGARPKASVLDANNNLWIAKFPSIKDIKNVGAWEMVVNTLAKFAGLTVAEGQAKQFKSNYHTFLTKRFDRTSKGKRIHFASAMTLLCQRDGAGSDTGVSYLDIMEFIVQHSAEVVLDLEELWRRIIFTICISNTDDHLRNHGFLLTEKGWRLSPAYDLNPNEFANGLSLNISATDNTLDLELAMSVKEYFRINDRNAKKIIAQVQNAVADWKKVASAIGISKTEQSSMAKAFRS